MNSDNKKPSWLARFFLFCSGTDIDLVKQCAKSTIIKRAALGHLVLITATLALFAGYYFFFTIFPQRNIALGGGLAWAIIVFSFDRFIVSTHRKGWASVLPATARFIMACFVALVVAHPLVLALFRGTIQEHLSLKNNQKKNEIIARYDSQTKDKETHIDLLRKEISNKGLSVEKAAAELELTNPETARLISEINRLRKMLADEIAGKSQRTGKKGRGPVAREIEQHIKFLEEQLKKSHEEDKKNAQLRMQEARITREQQQAQFDDLKRRNEALMRNKQNEILDLKHQRREELDAFKENTATDFLSRSNTLEELAAQNPNIQKWQWLLTLLFVAVDLLPVVYVTFSRTDDYDRKRQTEDDLNQHEESIKRNVSAKTKDLRERIAIKRVEVNEIEKELIQIVDLAITNLEQLDRFFLSIIQRDLEFRHMVNAYKQNLNGDQEHAHKVSEILKEYYDHSDEVTKETLAVLRSQGNGGHDRGARP